MFQPENLSILGAAHGGWMLWHYDAGEQPLTAVLEPGYFVPARKRMRHRDQVHISSATGGALVEIHIDGEVVTARPLAMTAAPIKCLACGATVDKGGCLDVSKEAAE
jgi:hypothetical protein